MCKNALTVVCCLFCLPKAVGDPQTLLEEKQALQEKLALCEYELRLAQEDTSKLKEELQKKTELPLLEISSKFLLMFECLYSSA